MDFSLIVILEACIFAVSCSIDAFAASFAYGCNKIKIPMSSVQIINIICSSIIGLSFLIGTIIKPYLPKWLSIVMCFVILFFIGTIKLLDSLTKSIIRKYNNFNKEIAFSFFNFKFILNLYANPEEADVDASRTISAVEAASLALALSLDGLALGIGAAFGNINGAAVFFFSLFTNALAVISGCHLGNKFADRIPFNISWFSGVVIIVLAFMKII